MKPFHILVSTNLIFILFLSACGGTAPEEISNSEPGAPRPTNTSLPSKTEISEIEQTPESSTEFVPHELVEKAKANLAEYLDINVDQIRVAEKRAVDWPDASLGCPQAETVYAQVITPGYLLLLEAQGQSYPYHTDREKQVVLCLKSQ